MATAGQIQKHGTVKPEHEVEKRSIFSLPAIWAVVKKGSVAGAVAFVGYLHAWLLYLIMLAIMSNVIPTIELRWWQLIKDRIEFVTDVTRCTRFPPRS